MVYDCSGRTEEHPVPLHGNDNLIYHKQESIKTNSILTDIATVYTSASAALARGGETLGC